MVFIYFATVLLALILLSVYILTSLEDYFFEQKKINLSTRANIVANLISKYTENAPQRIENLIISMQLDKDSRILVTDKKATVIFDNVEVGNLIYKIFIKEEIMKALSGKDVANKQYREDTGWVLEVSVPIIKEQDTIGVVYMLVPVQDVINILHDIRGRLILIIIAVSFLIGAFSIIPAEILTKPVEQLKDAIKRMSDGELNQKVEFKHSTYEIAQLGEMFNKMSERLLEMEEKRYEFVSNASHELKTPLSSIKVLSDSLLQASSLDMETVKEFLTDICAEIDRLSRITDHLLTLAKIDVNVVQNDVPFKKVDIKKILNSTVKILRPLAKNKDIVLRLNAPQSVFIMSDEDKLWEAIFNITDNSIKYTPSGGGVYLYLKKMRFTVEIIVEDTGIGIPEEDIGKVFDRFYRVDKARARDTGGTGLGLSIAHDAIKFLGGDIQVESVEEKGSKFTIILPYKMEG